MSRTIGRVKLFAGTFVPLGWLSCDGRLLRVDDGAPDSEDNDALAIVLGARFGGNGQSTVALPRIAAPPGLTYTICRDGMFGGVDDPTLGEVILFAGTEPLHGTLPCDGRALPISTNQRLFALLGIAFGGDGRVTFNVPKIPDLVPGVRHLICDQGLWPQS